MSGENVVGPNMKYITYPGNIYEIRDDKGDVLEIEAKDDPDIINFLNAFEKFLCVRSAAISSEVLARYERVMMQRWEMLPPRIMKEISRRRLGVFIPSS